VNWSIRGNYLREKKAINAVESKSAYLQQIEEFHQARANKLRERDLHVSINKMHIHMSETQLKEEEEEGIKQREEARRRKNWGYERNN
jgi:hypothetical protein